MKKTSMRQKNYRLRLELEGWIKHYLGEIKKTDPTDIYRLSKNLGGLEEVFRQYLEANKNKKI